MAIQDADGSRQHADGTDSAGHTAPDDQAGRPASDDYCYDMAHEVQAALRTPVAYTVSGAPGA